MWLIYVDVTSVSENWAEHFNNEEEAKERYAKLLEIYKDKISESKTEIFYAEVKMSSLQ
jgi:hypothetical protein